MIAIYYGHSEVYYGFQSVILDKIIYPFHVNAFFFVSGYLLFRKQLSSYCLLQSKREYILGGMIRNIFFRLIIPSVIFSILLFFPSNMLKGMDFNMENFLYKTIGGGTCWFTSALAVSEFLIFFLLLTRIKNIWFYFIASVFLFFVGQYLIGRGMHVNKNYPSFPWFYLNSMISLIFIAAGGIYWRYEDIFNKLMKRHILFLLIIFYALIVFSPLDIHVLVSMLDVNIPGVFVSVLSTLILIELCKLIPKCSILDYIGKHTIGLYFMCGGFPILMSMFMLKFSDAPNTIGLIAVFVGSFVLGLVMVFLINKQMPYLFDLRYLRKPSKN